MKADQFIDGLVPYADEAHRNKLADYGISVSNALGVRMPILKSYSKAHRGNKELALELYASDYHEAKLACALIFPPKDLNLEQADRFMEGFYSWDMVDQFCGYLFQKSEFARDLPFHWTPLPGEYQRRSGLVMILALSIHHKKMSDKELLEYLPLIKDYINDERNFVRKAHSWVLRTLGKRSPWLNEQIKSFIQKEWQLSNGKFKYWAATDAWRELNDPKVLARIAKQAARQGKA